MVVTLGQQYNVEDKPTVILYTYINRHARQKAKRKQKQCSISSNYSLLSAVLLYSVLFCFKEESERFCFHALFETL